MSLGGIKKYYIGFAVLILVALGALIYTLSQSSAAKVDNKTNKAVESVSNKLESYITTSGVPSSLGQAGIKDLPPTVQYTKLGDKKYKICFDYKTASNGFDASWTSLLGGAISGNYNYTPPADSTYFNSYVEFSHKKGQNCQTISEPDYSSLNYSSSSSSSSTTTTTGCNSYTINYAINGYAVISAIDTTSKTISFKPDNQYVSDNSGKRLAAITSISYDDKTLFCELSTGKIDASGLKVGDNATIYLNKVDDNTVARLDKYN